MLSTNSAFQWLHNDAKPRYMAPPFHAPLQKYAYPSPTASSEGNNSSLYNLLIPSFFSISSSFPFIQSSTPTPAPTSGAETPTRSQDTSNKNCFFDITVDSGSYPLFLKQVSINLQTSQPQLDASHSSFMMRSLPALLAISGNCVLVNTDSDMLEALSIVSFRNSCFKVEISHGEMYCTYPV